jgi:Na+-translocating ferredoxin:NAD+ oxidoreductase subunit B
MSNINELVVEALGKGTGREFAGGTDVCVCPECGFEIDHLRGIPCNNMVCPECGVDLTGKGTPGSTL